MRKKKKKKGRGSLDISPTEFSSSASRPTVIHAFLPKPPQFRQVIGRSPKSLEPLPPSCRHILLVTVVGSSGITLCIFLTCLPHIAHFFCVIAPFASPCIALHDIACAFGETATATATTNTYMHIPLSASYSKLQREKTQENDVKKFSSSTLQIGRVGRQAATSRSHHLIVAFWPKW